MSGEYLVTRALALVVNGDIEQGTRVAEQARILTGAVETQIGALGVLALAELGTARGRGCTEALIEACTRLDTWDGFVCVIRAAPRLLGEIAKVPGASSVLHEVLLRANDRGLLRSVGLAAPSSGTRRMLSNRESEVLELIALGLTNKQVANSLFIGASTVRTHVDSIFRKLGVHTRAEAVARYAESASARGDGS
jgi:DNA-binding CsgD family transcriptional regulator